MTAGETGPVVTLSGEADLSTAAELSEVLTRQVSSGSQHLTVDISELSFADSASVRTLVLAGRAMKDRGGPETDEPAAGRGPATELDGRGPDDHDTSGGRCRESCRRRRLRPAFRRHTRARDLKETATPAGRRPPRQFTLTGNVDDAMRTRTPSA